MPNGYLHYQLIEYLSVCKRMSPHGIAMNTSQHGATINCIWRGSRRGLSLEQTMPFTSHYCKARHITSDGNDIWSHIEIILFTWDWLRRLIGCSFGSFPFFFFFNLLFQPVCYSPRKPLKAPVQIFRFILLFRMYNRKCLHAFKLNNTLYLLLCLLLQHLYSPS